MDQKSTQSGGLHANQPTLESQVQYWDDWNIDVRTESTTLYMERLRHAAVQRVKHFGGQPRILEVGCGTGWLSESLSALGKLCGVDLSPKAVAVASSRCPQAEFRCGDFSQIAVEGPFDVAVTVDTIAHVEDQAAFIDRIAALLAPAGMLILMSQNAYALERSAWVKPVPGQIRRWLRLKELRGYLARDFTIEEVTTAGPEQATDGIYRLFNSRRVLQSLFAVIGKNRTRALYEKLRLGSEWVIVARRC